MVTQRQPSAPLSFAFWVRKVGPFLDRDGVLSLAALSGGELAVCEEFGDVLVLMTGDDKEKVYPSFQFGPCGERLPGLRDVTAILRPQIKDAWEIALWLTTVGRRYGGRSAIELLREGRSDIVMGAARRDVDAWQVSDKADTNLTQGQDPVTEASGAK